MTLILVVILVALAFEFINGFHDTANSIATVVSTKVLTPRQAIMMAAVTNLVGALVGHAVAKTVSSGLVDSQFVNSQTIICALLGGIVWNLLTWWLGLPSSSTHAMVGGLCGATLANAQNHWGAIIWSQEKIKDGKVVMEGVLHKVIWPMLGSPVIGLVGGFLVMTVLYALLRNARPMWVNRFFGRAQIFSASYMGFAHGLADAQKTMGIITLALVANGSLASGSDPPMWVVASAATAIALGTYAGGWRIIRTLGTRIIKMDPAQGFAAQGAGATVILASSHFGYPLSTTHTISGAIMGAGAAKRLSAVRWGVAGNIVTAWIFTLPAAGAIGAVVYGVTRIFGTGALGPIVVSILVLGLIGAIFGRRFREVPPPPPPVPVGEG
jgi:inorganic phosphate transporter, PiT family